MCGGQLLVVREDREWVTARSRHRQKAESDGMIQYDTEGQVQPQELLGFHNTTLWEEKEKYRKKNCRQIFLITLMIANEFSKLAKYSLLEIEPTVTS